MSTYNRERLDLFASLLNKKFDISAGRPWTIDPREMRFKHGETIAELKVPFHMGGEDETCIEQAVLGLTSLLMRRYEPKMEGAKEGAPLIITTGVLKDKTFRTDLFIADSLEKEIALEVLSGTPYIDSAIIANWLGSDGHGRRFLRWFSEYLEKMLKEEARAGGDERTSYLALLALVNVVRKKKEKVKGFRIKGLSYEKAELAIGLVMFHAIRTATLGCFRKLRSSGATYYSQAAETLLLSALTPRSFLSIPSNLVGGTINPYGVNNDTLEALSNIVTDIDEFDGSEEFISRAASQVRKNSEALEAVQAQSDINRFRAASLEYFSEFEQPGTEVQSILFELYNEDRLIKNFLSDQRAVGSLAEGLEEVKTRYARDQRRADIIEAFLKFLSGFRKSMLSSFLKGSKKAEETAPVIEGYFALRLDEHAETYAGLMRGYLADRREEFKNNMLVEEYGRGRLYRFSTDDRPVLKTLTIEEEGQLFVDMKDFTRKTLKVKEIAMADFMREYFYKPILNAASKYGMGTGIGADEKGIRLTNLPGDAAIFSGGVTYLVALAKDIQQIIRRYRDELTRRLPPRLDEEILEEVHKRFEARKSDLKLKRAELNAALESNESGVETRLVALGEEEHRLETTYREELETAIKGELEAGLYISYGAKAETVIVESRGEFSGPVSVSIGEKINEASRGTFRNPLVRAKLEMTLEAERTKKRDRQIKYPFDIYIDRVLSVKLPPELDSSFEKLISSRKDSSAKAMSQVMASEFYGDLNRIISGEPFSSLRVISSTKDIYNKGEALNIDALEAYIRENRGSKWFFNKKVETGSLGNELLEQFFFPSETLEFWFSHESVRGADRIEIFHKSGEVIFKGFEANTPMVIYELINPEGAFFKSIVKNHFHRWLEESKDSSSEEAL
ncbi:MAG: hypothetical protein IT362_05430 [Deltaproteobacteria bacterium]|nr:hypothetical protein [Deltaproteobacteria bacterium]